MSSPNTESPRPSDFPARLEEHLAGRRTLERTPSGVAPEPATLAQLPEWAAIRDGLDALRARRHPAALAVERAARAAIRALIETLATRPDLEVSEWQEGRRVLAAVSELGQALLAANGPAGESAVR
jgi:hypothetical protein